jgi:hypothetical protein
VLEPLLDACDSVLVVCDTIALTSSFSMYLVKLQIDPSCWVDVGGMEGQYGVW